MQTPIVSIVVALYQIEGLLPRFLASLSTIARNEHRVEVILVDDGSTDNTQRLAREFESRHDNARVLAHEVNRGLFCARQTGVEACTGRFVWLADGDDVLLQLDLDFIVQSITSFPTLDLFCFQFLETRSLEFDIPEFKKEIVQYKSIANGFILFPLLYWGNIWRYIIRRELLVNYYRQSNLRCDMGEDLVLTSWLGAHSGAAMLADSPIYLYRKLRPGSYTGKLRPLDRIETSVDLFHEICVRNPNNLNPATISLLALFSLSMRDNHRIETERAGRVDLVEKCLAIDDLALVVSPSQTDLAALIEQHSIGLRPNAAETRARRIIECLCKDQAA